MNKNITIQFSINRKIVITLVLVALAITVFLLFAPRVYVKRVDEPATMFFTLVYPEIIPYVSRYMLEYGKSSGPSNLNELQSLCDDITSLTSSYRNMIRNSDRFEYITKNNICVYVCIDPECWRCHNAPGSYILLYGPLAEEYSLKENVTTSPVNCYNSYFLALSENHICSIESIKSSKFNMSDYRYEYNTADYDYIGSDDIVENLYLKIDPQGNREIVIIGRSGANDYKLDVNNATHAQ